MPSRPNLTSGTRVRFQRLSDAKLFAGWVSGISEHHISIRSSGPTPVSPGDRFMVEVFGHGRNLQFEATLASALEEALELEVAGAMRETVSQEPVRVAVADLPCTLTWPGGQTNAEVVDISLAGLGLNSREEVPRGTKVGLEVRLPAGTVQCDGEIRYCRADKERGSSYRLGVLITYIDRINRARWWAQFESLAA